MSHVLIVDDDANTARHSRRPLPDSEQTHA